MKFLFCFLVSFFVCLSSSVANEPSKNISIKRKVTVLGISNKNILKAINEQVTVPPEKLTELELNFWMKRNVNTIRRILCAFGYFDAEVATIGDKTVENFNVKLNKRYTINGVECSYIGYNISETILNEEQFFILTGLKKGALFLGSEVSSSTNKIRDFYRNLGFAFVHVATPEIELSKTNKTVKIIYNVDLGKLIKTRNTIINIKSKKSPKLLEPFIRNRLTWKSNERYDLKKIERFKDSLVKYNLFSSLDVELSEPIPDKDNPNYGVSDTILNIEEAPLRSIQLGAKLSTTNVFNLLAGWKHYNIDGKGSTFEILGNTGKDEQIFKIEHNYYDLFFKNQRLSTQAKFTHEDETSYNILKYSASSIAWHNFGNLFEFGIGAFGEYSKTVDKVVADEKLINTNVPYIRTLGIQIGIKVNVTDDYIDSHHGFKMNADFTPMFSEKVNYSKFLGTLYGYFNISKNYSNREVVFAVYAKYGAIFGNTKKLTRDKIFFAGGANSIRGYGEKKLGAMLNRIPFGGTSLTELGTECRFRFNDAIGGAVFIETGKLHTPEKQQGWMTGFGFGIRYTPPINLPVIRVDIAFPTKRRKDNKEKYIDSLFNIYVGIGQAF